MKLLITIYLLLSAPFIPLYGKCLNVATTGDYYPFSLKKNNNYIGFDIDLINQIASKLNTKVCLHSTSWPTLSKDITKSNIDLAISGISITKKRQKIANFSIPYIVTGKTVVYRCDKQPTKQLNNTQYTVVFNPGGTNEQYVQKYLSKTKHVMHHNNLSIDKILLKQQADFFVTDMIEAKFLAYQYPHKLCYQPNILPNSTQKLALFIKNRALTSKINKILEQLIKNGFIQKLKQRYQL